MKEFFLKLVANENFGYHEWKHRLIMTQIQQIFFFFRKNGKLYDNIPVRNNEFSKNVMVAHMVHILTHCDAM